MKLYTANNNIYRHSDKMYLHLLSLCLFAATSGGDSINQRTNPKCDAKMPYQQVVPQGVDATKYAVAHGQLVLFGTAVFRPSHSCNGTTSLCGTRKIHFDVSCVLKGDGLPVADYISIGNDRYDPLCDSTFVPAGLNGQRLVVIVKRDPHGVNVAYNFDWHELVPQVPSYLLSSYLDLVLQVCGVDPEPPSNSHKPNTCPNNNHTDCVTGYSHTWVQVSNYGKYRISIGLRQTLHQAQATCRSLGARLLFVESRSEIDALLGALPNKTDMAWWTAGLIKDKKAYWEDYIYGDQVRSNVISWVRHQESLPDNAHLLMTTEGWTTTDNSTQELPFICKKDIKDTQPPFVPDDFQPQMRLRVTYFMSPSTRWTCCQNVTYKDKLITSDNLSAGMIQPYYMQKVPTLVLEGPGAQKSRYTYMMLDITTPSAPYVHYLLTNAGKRSTGDDGSIVSYKAPLPRKMHHYLFLAFKQMSGSIYVNTMAFSDRNCAERPRCSYYVSKFVEEYQLRLVAVAPVTAQTDAYTVQRLIDTSHMPVAKACQLIWPKIQLVENRLVCTSSNTAYKRTSDKNTAVNNSYFCGASFIGVFTLLFLY